MQTRKIVRTIGFSLFIIAILSISGMVELAASADARNSSSDADTSKSVYANDEDLSTWCTTYSRGHPPPGSWDSSTHTCTVTGTLLWETSQFLAGRHSSFQVVVNSPSIADTHSPSTAADTSLDNSGGTGGGITNDGTIANSGTVTVENSGSTLGIENLGTFTNGGTVDVENTGSAYGTGLDNAGTFTNEGTVTLENSGNTTGIYNSYFTFTNDGTVDIENTGYSGYGIYSNETTINNIGFTYIANSGSESDGIYNDVAGTINNECSGTIDIAARNGGTGLYNLGTINNSGTITGTVSGNRIATSPACTIHALGTAVCINGVCGVTTGKAPASVYDTAYLIFSGGPPGQEAPTGSVFYTLYTGKTCEGTVLGTSFVTVKGGAGLGGYSTQEEVVPNSTTFAGLAPGSYSFEATYTSNNGYPSSSSTCTSAYLESFVVTPFYPIGVLSVLTPLIALAAFVMLSKRKSRQL